MDGKWWFPTISNMHSSTFIRGFPKIMVPQTGWFIVKNPIKMDDLGVPPFKETPIHRKQKTAGFLASQARDGGSFVDWVTFTMRLWRRIFLGGENPWLLVFCNFWCFPKIGVPQNGWFIIRENPIRMDDLGVPYFWKHSNRTQVIFLVWGFECSNSVYI